MIMPVPNALVRGVAISTPISSSIGATAAASVTKSPTAGMIP